MLTSMVKKISAYAHVPSVMNCCTNAPRAHPFRSPSRNLTMVRKKSSVSNASEMTLESEIGADQYMYKFSRIISNARGVRTDQ